MKLLINKSEANFYAATRTNLGYGTYGYAPVNTLAKAKKINKVAQVAGKVGSFLGKNKGKAGLAGVGLVGAGVLASKTLNKPKTLESRLKKTLKKNPQLNQVSKMFR
jgi:hypothetical protein